MPEPITDETLDEWAAGKRGRGYENSVEYLRELSPEDRATAVSEARAILNTTPILDTTPGYVFSGAVCQAVQNVKRGDLWGRRRADALMAYDPTGEKAAAHAGDWNSFVRQALNSNM